MNETEASTGNPWSPLAYVVRRQRAMRGRTGQISHRSHGGTGLLSAAASSAAPVLRTAAATEVAGDPSDGGDGVEPSSPT